VGHYLTPDDVRERFVRPLEDLSGEFAKTLQALESAYESGRIARPDLLLNDVLPAAALSRLRKLLRESSCKLEDAVAGVYPLPPRGGLADAAAEIAAGQIAPRRLRFLTRLSRSA